MKLGFIGLGVMGRPMALNLMKAGHTLVVHDVRRDAAKPRRTRERYAALARPMPGIAGADVAHAAGEAGGRPLGPGRECPFRFVQHVIPVEALSPLAE